MSDPRILPSSTLDTYRADIKRANDNDLGHVWLWRAQELLGHIDAVARHRAEAKAEALREAADAMPAFREMPPRWSPLYRAKAWLLDRADRIEKEQDRD